jgi:hypothetical protein
VSPLNECANDDTIVRRVRFFVIDGDTSVTSRDVCRDQGIPGTLPGCDFP